jgi:hypothetical protein
MHFIVDNHIDNCQKALVCALNFLNIFICECIREICYYVDVIAHDTCEKGGIER